jgi:hypothetical protein
MGMEPQRDAIGSTPTPQSRQGFQKGVSGNPSGATFGKKAAAIYDAVVADFGGADALSAIDCIMLEQACRLLSRTHRIKIKDTAVAIRMSSEARRLLESLRRRIPKASNTSHTSPDWLDELERIKQAPLQQEPPP